MRLCRLIEVISVLAEHLLIKKQVCWTLLRSLEHLTDVSFACTGNNWQRVLSPEHKSLVLSLSVVQESWKDGAR